MSFPRVLPVGDAALTVELGDRLDPETNARVRTLDRDLAATPFDGFRESVPTHRSQPNDRPASTATRALTEGGSTLSRYSVDCSSNSSQLGMDTRRTLMPAAASRASARTMSCTSDPVAIRITSGGSDPCARAFST